MSWEKKKKFELDSAAWSYLSCSMNYKYRTGTCQINKQQTNKQTNILKAFYLFQGCMQKLCKGRTNLGYLKKGGGGNAATEGGMLVTVFLSKITLSLLKN